MSVQLDLKYKMGPNDIMIYLYLIKEAKRFNAKCRSLFIWNCLTPSKLTGPSTDTPSRLYVWWTNVIKAMRFIWKLWCPKRHILWNSSLVMLDSPNAIANKKHCEDASQDPPVPWEDQFTILVQMEFCIGAMSYFISRSAGPYIKVLVLKKI